LKEKAIIIKQGALGDVLRTTSILRRTDWEVTWIVDKAGLPLVEGNPRIHRSLTLGQAEGLKSEHFNLVLSLDDDPESLAFASALTSERLIGAFLSDGVAAYSEESAGWFDMGLISRLGLARANEMKVQNVKPYQEYLFEMVGLQFRGEEYMLPEKFNANNDRSLPLVVGIEARAGARWPLKKWDKYPELHLELQAKGFEVKEFEQKEQLSDYIEDINATDVVVTGDTLAMHVALALGKQVVAIFGPTPSEEIYGYGRLRKVVSPLDCIKCYKRHCDYMPNCMQSIPVERVMRAVEEGARAVGNG